MDSADTQQVHRLSGIIDIEKLERESRKFLYIGFLTGMILQIVAGLMISREIANVTREERSIVSIPTSLLFLPPRVENPYESWIYTPKKREYPRMNRLERFQELSMPAVPKHEGIIRAKEYKPDIESQLSETVEHEFNSDFYDSLLADGPGFLAPDTIIPMESKVFVDTGRYKSQVIVPPGDKTAIQGYVKIAIGCVGTLILPDYLKSAARNLARVLKSYSNIYAEYDYLAWVDEPPEKEFLQPAIFQVEKSYQEIAKAKYVKPFNRLNQYPFLYFTTDRAFTLEESEISRLGNYLKRGGFIILDNGRPEYGAKSISNTLISMLYDAINHSGVIRSPKKGTFNHLATVKTLPHSHPLYHCFFDFDNGPPPSTCTYLRKNEIAGIYFHNRLVGIYCPQGYGISWSDRNNIDQFKIGVNLVVYALTRPQGTLMMDREKERLYWRDKPSGPIRSW